MAQNNNKSKALELVYLTRVEGANLNSAGTEGVISVLKKTEDIDGKEYVRISGQSIKYQIREIWREKGLPVSPVESRSGEEKVIVSAGEPENYIDDDLFGYMIEKGTGKEENRKRTACVRTNGMISIFPYKGDRDFAVRYDPKDPTGKHNIYEVELTTNVMRGNIFVELDRIGKFEKFEMKDKTGKEIKINEKEKRLKALFDAVLNLFGGAHLSNYFTKIYPEIVVVSILNRKIPVIGDKLSLSGKKENSKYVLNIPRLKETISTFDEYIEDLLIGGFETEFENWDDVKKLANSKIKVLSIKELRDELNKKSFF